MQELEQLLALFVVAVVLAGAARRVGAPYPVFLAIGGALLAFVPGIPPFSVAPELALAIFVAPVLLDAAFDASLRELRENWGPLVGLVVCAVVLTTAAVAVVVHALVPGMPWAAAIVLGAVVAPPDAVAATAVLAQVEAPHRIVTILEGESLLNDATALLIYRVAVGAAVGGGFSLAVVAPTFLLGVGGSVVIGPALAWVTMRVFAGVQHVPTAIILQFVTTFCVWILAERVGLSGVLTTVTYAMTAARLAPSRITAQVRLPTEAVWRTVVFALNILAFIFVGLQLRPILEALPVADRVEYGVVALAVLVTVIVVRFLWHLSFNGVTRWRHGRTGFRPRRPMLRPSVGSGVVISWAGMRGIVTLAAALALPPAFPYRGLIVLTAFAVVLGTLVLQGMTLKQLLRIVDLGNDDPREEEMRAARARAFGAACAALGDDASTAARHVRQEFEARFGPDAPTIPGDDTARREQSQFRQRAGLAARRAVVAMRESGEIGDGAFHEVEKELDWLEVTGANEAANDR